MIIALVSVLATGLGIWLGGAWSLWGGHPISKQRLAALLAIAAAVPTAVNYGQRRADTAELGSLRADNQSLRSDLADQKRLISIADIKAETRAIKQETQAVFAESQIEAKVEAVHQAVDGRKGYGTGTYGDGPYGGGEPPLARIASSLHELALWVSNDATTWLVRNDAWGPRRQVVEYLSSVEKIPPFYNDEEWSQSEQLIFAGIQGDISSNLSQRNMNSPGALDRYSGVLMAERKRYLAARARKLTHP